MAAIACGAVYVVLNPPRPVITRVTSEPPSRLLPYEEQIARTRDAPAAPAPQNPAAAPAAAAPAASAPAKAAPEQAAAPKPDTQVAGTAHGKAGSQDGEAMPPTQDPDANVVAPPDGGNASDQAALPPDDGGGQDDGSGQYDVTAVPPGAAPPGDPYANAPYGPRPNVYGPPQKGPSGPSAYGPPPQDGPYGQGGPYGQAPQDGAYDQPPQGGAYGAPGEPSEEWVQVLVSGAGMYGTASEDAPMLFAFPYGRRLKVVSRYEGWVEVTDPQSATTGWMKAGHVAPIAAPGVSAEQVDAGYEDERRPGWLRRHGGGLGDIISRALGGGF
jgi:hypothetical protein